MQKAIIGKKIGMTQIFDEAGHVVPVTLIKAGGAEEDRREGWLQRHSAGL